MFLEESRQLCQCSSNYRFLDVPLPCTSSVVQQNPLRFIVVNQAVEYGRHRSFSILVAGQKSRALTLELLDDIHSSHGAFCMNQNVTASLGETKFAGTHAQQILQVLA